MEKIKFYVQEKPTFLIVDEAEIAGEKYVNIIVGTLESPKRTFLLDCIPLESAANSDVILRIVDAAIPSLQVSRTNFNLLLSDAAPHMLSAGKMLHRLFPKLFHVTCTAHLIHNCAMKVRSHYSEVDQLIGSINNAIVKNKTRLNDFAEIGSPPDTIITRWASWLNTALYYGKNLPAVQSIVRNCRARVFW